MMKRTKGFGEPLHSKKQSNDFKKLSKKTLQMFGDSGIAGIRMSSSNEVKMSEVLEVFVDPYMEIVHKRDRKERQKLLELAIIAWNIAVIYKNNWQSKIQETLVQIAPDMNPASRQDLQAVLGEMIERKLEFFGNINRMIVNFELKETKHNFELLVASTTEQPEPDKKRG